MVDIMVREEDGAKLNRISERFNFRSLAKVKEEFEKSKQDKIEANDINKLKSEDEQFIDDIMPKTKEQKEIPSSDTKETVEKNQSEISLNTKLNDKMESSKENKKSVKQELAEISNEIKQKEKQEIKTENIKTEYKGGKHYKEKREKHKGKRYKEPNHLANKSKNKTKGRSI